MLDRITPLILTRDEAPNIERALQRLAWAKDVVVVDSFSTDGTVEMARRFPNVRVLQRQMDSLASQSNHGLAQARTPWALLLDADYMLTPELVEELRALEPPPDVDAYRASFLYAIGGRALRSSLYPPRIVLLRRERARVWQDGHAHRVEVAGSVGDLRARIIHDDRKSFRRFLERQRTYARQEAEKLRGADPASLRLPSRIRRWVVIAPAAVLVHTLLVKGVVLDGWPGLRYAWERFVAEAMLSAALLARMWKRGPR
jgi:glycosyltransferase involved in cell wall biosynthesis